MGSCFSKNHFQYTLPIEFRNPNVTTTLQFGTFYIAGVTR